MVDTQQLLAWPVGFSLNTMELPELYDHPHSVDLKHLTTLDYTSISSSSTQSSMSPSLVPCISPADMAYDPSPPLSEEHLTNMDYLNMHGCSKSTRGFLPHTGWVHTHTPVGLNTHQIEGNESNGCMRLAYVRR